MIQLREGEQLLWNNAATVITAKSSMFMNGELSLTNERIMFEQRVVFQKLMGITSRKVWEVPLSEIQETGGKKSVGIIPNRFYVKLKSGDTELFIVNNDRERLLNLLEGQKGKYDFSVFR